MTLTTPPVSSLHTKYKPWRVSSFRRNSSSPFSLAIPSRSERCSIVERADTQTQTRNASGKNIELQKLSYPVNPTFPKKARVSSTKLSFFLTQVVDERADPPAFGEPKHSSLNESSLFSKKREKTQNPINDHVLALAVTLTLAILIAIGIPLGVILPQKYMKPLPVNILVPLFLNPVNVVPDRLEDSILRHVDTNFTIILNPGHDTNDERRRTEPYVAAIQKFIVYPNVRILGYVDTAQGTIPNAALRAKIAAYAAHSSVAKGLALHGVYFDHTPWQDDDKGLAKEYLRNVSATVRHTSGWAGEQNGMVIHNPGRVPDPALMAYGPDIVVTFEGRYEDLPTREELDAQLSITQGSRENYAMLVNSVPEELNYGDLRKIVERVKRDVEWLHVTDLSDDMYHGLGSIWERWVDVTW